MDNLQDILGNNSSEDIRWLCNLSESELDMLIRLKSLILHRAKVLGHDELAKNFDFPTLRAIGLLLIEYLKGKVKDLSDVQGLTKLATFPECCNLLKGNTGDDSSIEELKACIGIDERKRPTKSPVATYFTTEFHILENISNHNHTSSVVIVTSRFLDCKLHPGQEISFLPIEYVERLFSGHQPGEEATKQKKQRF